MLNLKNVEPVERVFIFVPRVNYDVMELTRQLFCAVVV
jgi:hypothetical protein